MGFKRYEAVKEKACESCGKMMVRGRAREGKDGMWIGNRKRCRECAMANMAALQREWQRKYRAKKKEKRPPLPDRMLVCRRCGEEFIQGPRGRTRYYCGVACSRAVTMEKEAAVKAAKAAARPAKLCLDCGVEVAPAGPEKRDARKRCPECSAKAEKAWLRSELVRMARLCRDRYPELLAEAGDVLAGRHAGLPDGERTADGGSASR